LINGRNLGKIQRCSRPLCSSQATDEPTRQTRAHHYQQAGGYTHDPMTRVLQKHPTLQDPTRPHRSRMIRPGRHDPVAGCLRTQQCARRTTPTTVSAFQPQGGVLTSSAARAALRQCSTHEQPPQTRTAWAWPLPPAPASRAGVPGVRGLVEMSSLERR
jgi:hypothetical protein